MRFENVITIFLFRKIVTVIDTLYDSSDCVRSRKGSYHANTHMSRLPVYIWTLPGSTGVSHTRRLILLSFNVVQNKILGTNIFQREL